MQRNFISSFKFFSVDFISPSDTDQKEILYPERGQNTLSEKLYIKIPYNVGKIYKELISSFNNGNLTLCTIGLKTLVEAICQNCGILDGLVEVDKDGEVAEIKRKDDLRGRINGLQEKGFLSKNNANILHEHRLFGNDAVHEFKMPSIDELKIGIETIEHILYELYALPEKAKKFKHKKSQSE